ncbi:Bcr/CflA family efflux MFS transporter [Campylobacter sp. 19-13652]|uniref:Bcr/CflA family efflux MFS transporter n=1 Tax=Campylobacter sp. 19-13652 TaxID=2840180 RepID=UPI001C78E0D1|nr:Bcr/CflA family efflux MFS transporter [Campylobacter sp. 19-13652]BCX79128.1 Bcr/CflA family drug resistance efflux transporter [Campylobacter sp. 19-13652]
MNKKLFLLPFLGALSAFGPFVLDLYLPALPLIQKYFSTSTSYAQLTLSTTMAGLAFGQLIAGPLSDKFGRKIPLLISLMLYTISTIIIFFTPSIEIFIAMRAIEGLASAGSIVIARAIVGDLYEGEEMRRFFSLLVVINSLAPIFSPIIGSFILTFASWRGEFTVLSVIGVLLFIASFKFHESLPKGRRLKGGVLQSYGVYLKLICMRDFLVFVAISAGALDAIFTYISASAFILEDTYGFSQSQFAFAFAANGAGFGIAASLASRLSARQAMIFGAFLLIFAGVFLAISLIFKFDAIFLMTLFFAVLFSAGFILPTTSFYAISLAKSYAGSASALLGFAGFSMGGIVSASIGRVEIFNGAAVSFLLCSALCFFGVGFAYFRGLLR